MLVLQREFGDIAAVIDRSPALVCAFGAAHNREVLTKGAVFQHDTELPMPAPKGSALHTFTSSVTFVSGEAHRKSRQLLMPAFQKPSLDGYAHDILATTNAALDEWPVGETTDIARLVRVISMRVAFRCFFGVERAENERQLAELEWSLLATITSPLTMALPLEIPGTPYHRLIITAERIRTHLLALIEHKRQQPAGQTDALSRMIRAHDEDGSSFTDDELLANVHTLFVAGHDTSAQTLVWTLFLLERHPEILADVLDELDAVFGGAPPTVERIGDLVLLDRVIKESMRIMPAAPMLFLRVCASETPLGPYVLPAQANVILSPFVTQRDPELYRDPARFQPQRWEQIQPSIYEYLPFGAGPRTCIGLGFASMSIRLILPMVLQRFRLTLAPGARISREVRGLVLRPKHGLPMMIRAQDRRFARGERVRGDIHEIIDLV